MILSPFSLLLTSPPASGVFLGRHFVVVYDNVTVSLVPPTPLLGIAPLRDRWFAVGTLASLCGSLQQRCLVLGQLCHGVVWGLQRELVRGKTSSTTVWHCRFHFASCAERFARCYMSFNCAAECFSLLLQAGVPTL